MSTQLCEGDYRGQVADCMETLVVLTRNERLLIESAFREQDHLNTLGVAALGDVRQAPYFNAVSVALRESHESTLNSLYVVTAARRKVEEGIQTCMACRAVGACVLANSPEETTSNS